MNITLYRKPTIALGTWLPLYRRMSLIDEIDQLARELWQSWQPELLSNELVPHIDMYEEKGELVIKGELPGVNKENLEVTLDRGTLTIKAEKKEEVDDDATHHSRERYYGKYVRSMSLPPDIDEDKISATFENGVLELRIPKAEETEPKKIQIKAQLAEGKEKKQQRKPKKKSG